jgi:Winged helix DNA-binding domain
MERQLLDPVGTLSVPKVVRRLCGVQAQVASSAELAVRVRRQRSRPGDVERALADGRLIKTWAMRGALHLLAPEDAGAFLALFAAERVWEKPSWQRHFGLTAKHWGDLRRVVRDALDRTVLTRDELAMAISRHRGFSHLADQLRSGWGTLLKPLAWQGDLCFGPSAANRVTFTRPDSATTRWGGLPDPNQAAPAAIVAYLRASSHCIATFPTRRASSTASRSLV